MSGSLKSFFNRTFTCVKYFDTKVLPDQLEAFWQIVLYFRYNQGKAYPV